MRRLSVGLALHNHQPVGNFDWVLEDNFRRAYLPMLEALERHPRIRAALHYSGHLLDWLRSEHPDFVERVAARVAAGQVEVMGGGYYEPVLPAIPDRDKHAQLTRLADAVEASFGRRPAGLWLAERVWEASLPKPLAEAGYRYTILDDSHFERVGLREADLHLPFLTEEQGHSLKLLATGTRMRYLIPWRSVEECRAYFREVAAEEPRLVLMGDDGEKFGGWPTTDRLCWQEGWVDGFFTMLEAESRWIETVLPGEFVDRHRARGPVYLPAGSYPEMLRWAGGFWRNFLARYPEVNAMHKKMLRVSGKVAAAGSPPEALGALLRGQANDAYWHGVFGGVYLPHLRRGVWQGLLEAEAAVAGGGTRREVVDYDGDGACEVLLESPAQNVYLAPAAGGAVVEWDVAGRNLADVIARRPEPYHQRLRDGDSGSGVNAGEEPLRVREPGLEKLLHYDRRRRLVFQAYLAPPATTLGRVLRATHRELGGFAAGEFEPGPGDSMTRTALAGGALVRMRKAIRPAGRGVALELELEVGAERGTLAALLVVESNLALPGGPLDGTVAGRPLDRAADLGQAAELRLEQPGAGAAYRLELPPGARAWYHPVETVNNSEAGYERILQGACLLAALPVTLGPEPLKLRYRLHAGG